METDSLTSAREFMETDSCGHGVRMDIILTGVGAGRLPILIDTTVAKFGAA